MFNSRNQVSRLQRGLTIKTLSLKMVKKIIGTGLASIPGKDNPSNQNQNYDHSI